MRTLSGLLSDGPLILYFYPADFTLVARRKPAASAICTRISFKARLRVVGVSPQDTDSHRRFAEKHNLNFTLLSDPGKKVIKAYELDGPLGIGVRRGPI